MSVIGDFALSRLPWAGSLVRGAGARPTSSAGPRAHRLVPALRAVVGKRGPETRSALKVAAPFVRPEARRLALASAAAVLEIGCTLAGPWPLALAVDHALGGRPLTGAAGMFAGWGSASLLLVAGAAVLVITAVGGLLDLCSETWAAGAVERIGGALRRGVFDHVLRLSPRWQDRTRSGEVLSRLTTDVGRVLDAVTETFTTLLPDVLLLCGTVVVLFVVDPTLAWLALAVLPAMAWLSSRQRHRVRTAELEARDAGGRLSAVATDLLRNVRAVQAFGRLDRAAHLFAGPNERTVAAEIRALVVRARWAPVLDGVLALGTGVVLVAGGMQVLAGRLSTGELLVVMTYVSSLHSPVRGLVRLGGLRARATASALRLQDILQSTETVPVPLLPRPVPPVRDGIRLEGVDFSYAPDRPVLRGFDLSVAAGETVCLFGPSGAGKSTVLQLLLRLYDPDAGRVLVDGVDVRDLDPIELRRRIAFAPQDPWLLDGTLAENIAFGRPGATRLDVLVAGWTAAVHEFAMTLPQGYDTPLGESGLQLSGGQRRRVAVARAVLSRAPVLLLDEPTTSLDAVAARRVINAVRSAAVGRTVLLVTHDPALAAVADRVVPIWRCAQDSSAGEAAPEGTRAGIVQAGTGVEAAPPGRPAGTPSSRRRDHDAHRFGGRTPTAAGGAPPGAADGGRSPAAIGAAGQVLTIRGRG